MKTVRLLMGCLLAILLFLVTGPSAHAEEVKAKVNPLASLKRIKTTATDELILLNEAPAFQFVEGKRIEVATLARGSVYPILDITDDYYSFSYGNDRLYVLKESATTRPAASTYELLKSDYTVLTTARIPVYDLDKPGANIVAYVEPNMRMTVVRETAYYQVQMGGKRRFIEKQDTVKDSGVPVLMYHHMIENAAQSDMRNNRMVIDVKQFEEQMDYLVNNGWTAITMETFRAWKEKEIDLPRNVVVITFDDGILSTVVYAYPILKNYNMPAVSFAITGKIRQQAAPWDPATLQNVGLKEIRETADVFDYQHHTHYYHLMNKEKGLPFLLTESYEAILADLEQGKFQLGKAFEGDTERVKYLAYPFGQYNETTLRAVTDAGIRYAFTTNTGNVRLGDSPLELNRQGIAPEHTLADFEAKLLNTFK
ncbi:polysaccharide deacetylase family protein [Sporosarcina sp. NPDC096371]|uniref:polysaccharide deacetylase family protein n=1 Tax=Sporosarcina sp. NPDC096371 TaxID=3364530 RepID=UPI0038148045